MPETENIFKCSWSGCCCTFTRNESLGRHIRTIHKKERTHICSWPKCGALFGNASDLKRHCLSVHIKERNFKCSQCFKAFNTSGALHKHEQSIHGTKISTSHNTIRIEKPSYECAECGFCSTRRDHLVRHISKTHVNKEYFECNTCSCRYYSKIYLKKHIFEKHEQVHRKSMKKSHICCIICKKSFQHRSQIETHYQEFHHVDLDTEKHTFPTMQHFLNWKEDIEDSTKTIFNIKDKTKWRITYICHRSGPARVKTSDRKKACILKRSKKLNGVCPASITLLLNKKDSSCVATFLQTHVGHQSNDKKELKYYFVRAKDRKKMPDVVTSRIPKRKSLNDNLEICTHLLYDFENTNVAKNYVLRKKRFL